MAEENDGAGVFGRDEPPVKLHPVGRVDPEVVIVEPDDARRSRSSQQTLDDAASYERPKAGHCDDARLVHGTPLGGGSDARLAAPHRVRYHAPR